MSPKYYTGNVQLTHSQTNPQVYNFGFCTNFGNTCLLQNFGNTCLLDIKTLYHYQLCKNLVKSCFFLS